MFSIGLPSTVIEWATTLGFVITGVFALYSMFDKATKSRREESNVTDDRLISLLKDQVEALEKRASAQDKALQEQSVLIRTLETKIDTINKDNERLTLIFQGRDTQTQEFQQQGFEAIKLSKEIYKAVVSTNNHMSKLYESIDRHLERLEQVETAPKKETIVKTTQPL